jgi:hypothetical protein
MNMTPNKILSLPVRLSGSTLGIVASVLVIPGGLVMALAFGLYWLADRMSKSSNTDEYRCDMTIEEYESDIGMYDRDKSQGCGNCVYNDACLTEDDDWCDGWESDDYED